MAYSEGDGVRSVGQLDSKQKGSFIESPFLSFPVCLVNEGAKGVDGFASAALASTGPRGPKERLGDAEAVIKPWKKPSLLLQG